jgi:lysylphosphatidylglycerol synthetase-like protein (DUF2156 family)
LEGLAFDGDLLIVFATFFGCVTIEVDVLGPLEGLASDSDRLIVFAMVVLIFGVVWSIFRGITRCH